METRRIISVASLLLIGPLLVMRPSGVDSLLLHAHDDHELHHHANSHAEDWFHDHDHDHDAGRARDPGGIASVSLGELSSVNPGRELLVVLPEVAYPSGGSPSRVLAKVVYPDPRLELGGFDSRGLDRLSFFATGPPRAPVPPAARKAHAILLRNHAFLL